MFTLSLLSGTVIATVIYFCFIPIADDSILYAMVVHSYNNGDWYFDLAVGKTPLLPLISLIFVKMGFNSYDATYLTGSLFYVLTIVPLYFLLKPFLGILYASWGCLFYIVAPHVIRWECIGLPDSIRIFLTICSVLCLLSYFRNRKIYKLFLLGMFLSGCSILREEGIVFTALAFLLIFFFHFRNGESRLKVAPFFIGLRDVCVILVVMFVLLSPRIYQVYNYTGYPALSMKQSQIAGKIYNKLRKTRAITKDVSANALASKKESKSVNCKNTDFEAASDVSAEGKLDKSNSGLTIEKPAAAAKNKYKEFAFIYKTIGFVKNVAGEYSLYYLMMLIGLVVVLSRKLWNLSYTVIFSFFILNSLLFSVLNPLTKQYFVLNTVLLLPLSVICYKEHLELMKEKGFKRAFLFFVFFVVLFQIFFGFNSSAESGVNDYTRKLGSWIANNKCRLSSVDELRSLTILAVYKPQIAYWSGSNVIYPKDKSIPNISKIIKNGAGTKESVIYKANSQSCNEFRKPDLVISHNRPKFSELNEYLLRNPALTYVRNGIEDSILIFKRN